MLDRLLAILLITILSPVLVLLVLLLLLVEGSPVFFSQERAGLGGKVFTMYKLRSFDRRGQAVTFLGRLLRRSSLDELPQLWNIAKGNMAFVGPRPLLPAYTAGYTHTQSSRLKVKPGLTGLAQVLGRNAISWDRRFAADAYFIRHSSWKLRLWIVYRTPSTLLSNSGSNASGQEVSQPQLSAC